jgi:hypothetical protein
MKSYRVKLMRIMRQECVVLVAEASSVSDAMQQAIHSANLPAELTPTTIKWTDAEPLHETRVMTAEDL